MENTITHLENPEGKLRREDTPDLGSNSIEINSTQTVETNHRDEIPATNINTELRLPEETHESVDTVAAVTSHINGTTTSAEDSNTLITSECGTPQPLSTPNVLDFSLLDPGSKGLLLPVRKEFLCNYSRNLSTLNDKETSGSKHRNSDSSKNMYSVLDSDSESDSTAENSHQGDSIKHANPRPCAGSKATDEEEEKVEICHVDSNPSDQLSQTTDGNLNDGPSCTLPGNMSSSNRSMKIGNSSDVCQGEPLIHLQKKDSNCISSSQSDQELTRNQSKPLHHRCPPVISYSKEHVFNGVNPSVSPKKPLNSQNSPSIGMFFSSARETFNSKENKCQSSSQVMAPQRVGSCENSTKMLCQKVVTFYTTSVKVQPNGPLSSDKDSQQELSSTLAVTESNVHLNSKDTFLQNVSTKSTSKDKVVEKLEIKFDSKSSTSQVESNVGRSSSMMSSHSTNGVKKDKPEIVNSLVSKLSSLSSKTGNNVKEAFLVKENKGESSEPNTSSVPPLRSPDLQSKLVSIINSKQEKTAPKSPKICDHHQNKTVPKPGQIQKTTRLQAENFPRGQFGDKGKKSMAHNTKGDQDFLPDDPSSETISKHDDKPRSVTTQRSFIEVRLSSPPSSSVSTPVLRQKGIQEKPVIRTDSNCTSGLSKRGLSGSKDTLTSQNKQAESPTALGGMHQFSAVPDNTELDTEVLLENNHICVNNGLIDVVFKPNNLTEKSDNLNASQTKPHFPKLARRSYSTDCSGPLDSNSFSVRQRIKSFENLASFDKSVVRSIDTQYYALAYTPKPPLSRRLSGYAGCGSSYSIDSQAFRRSVSWRISSPPIDALTEKKPLVTVSQLEPTPVAQTPPVVRRKVARGLSRSRLREVRALSMPDLDKLCTDGFSSEEVVATFKTEPTSGDTGLSECLNGSFSTSSKTSSFPRAGPNEKSEPGLISKECSSQENCNDEQASGSWSIRFV